MKEHPICPYCGAQSKLVDSSVIYNGRSFGWAYVCSSYPKCDAYVGCHPGTKNPLGRLADKELRRAKGEAHTAFDRLWRGKIQLGSRKKAARSAGYLWLAEQLGIDPRVCHIGMFDVQICKRVVEICSPYQPGQKLGGSSVAEANYAGR